MKFTLALFLAFALIIPVTIPTARALDPLGFDCNQAMGGLPDFPEVSTDDIDYYAVQRTKLLEYEAISNRELAMTRLLREKDFTPQQIAQRIEEFNSGNPGGVRRVLGVRTLSEVRERIIGESIEKVSPDSLIGQYLKETGARSQIIRVPLVKGGAELGPPKLLVAVGPESFASLQKLLSTEHYLSVMGHANLLHRNQFWSYGGGPSSALALPKAGTPLPLLLLSTTESERLHRYLVETTKEQTWYSALKQPWQLPGYCAKGGYSCCTHWIGNIPIGDKMVNEYKFPAYDRPANEANIKPLEAYVGGSETLRKIWKVPGHEQLASAIGLEENNLVGEFASPGWVIQTLMGSGSTERVPVILVSTLDHRGELPKIEEFVFEMPR